MLRNLITNNAFSTEPAVCHMHIKAQQSSPFAPRQNTPNTQLSVSERIRLHPISGGRGGGGREEISPLNIKRLGFDINELHAAHRSSG